ncbi:phosphorothioated DNA-binding restriction endonuclease [Streptomyces lichenis]|uniref:HNH endonuclease n=1 Tax=Streptomyces lichenis TaxID=2306967 RepID=A0ABT0I553_9ACTN|nr:HNH endonuclease [Streptomyces lichenis]MCK8676439.1 HNH endonuclease [Streptomyces lichenis]
MDWLERVAGLRQWARGGARAPHKPLLLLYALGRFQEDSEGELRYSDVEGDLKRLLAEYGPRNRTTPAYPFHHLTGDGVWEVSTDGGAGSPGPLVTELRASGARGRLDPELRAALRRDPALLARMARILLDLHFPPSLHGELCEAAGLELEYGEFGGLGEYGGLVPGQRGRRRDRRMREMVLAAYEYRCAFCGYDGALGMVPVGLKAAHVRWWAFKGPDDVDNGLCLCALHHKLFDKGVLGLGEDLRVVVSARFTGRSAAAEQQVRALSGRALIGPRTGSAPVAAEHRSWHTDHVFHGNGEARGPQTVASRSPA